MRFLRFIAPLFLLARPAATLAAPDIAAALQVPKQAPIGGPTLPGVLLTNSGSSAATGTQFAFTLPSQVAYVKFTTTTSGVTCTQSSGTVQCSIPTIAAQQSVKVYVMGTVSPSTAPGTQLAYSVVAAAPGDSNPSNDIASATSIAQPLPNISPTSTFPATFVAGAPLGYTVTIRNNGGAATNIRFADTTDFNALYTSVVQRSGPAGNCTVVRADPPAYQWSCSFATFPATSTATFDVTLSTGPAAFASPVHEEITLSDDDMSLVLADLVKESQGTQVADVGVAASAPASVRSGEDLSYTVNVTNAGPSSTAPTLTWTTPAGTTFASVATTNGTCSALAAGSSGTVTCSAGSVAPGLSAGYIFRMHTLAPGTVVNSASITAPGDSTAANNTTSSTTIVAEPPSADVSLAMSADSYALTGRPFSLELTFSNAGPQTAQAVTASVPLPPGVTLDPSSGCGGTTTAICNAGDLAPGATVKKTLTAIPPTGVTLAFTATATSPVADPNAANNSASVSLPLYPALADVSISLGAIPSLVPPAGEIAFNLAVTNSGPAPAKVSFTADFPAGSKVVANAGCADAPSGGGLACSAEIFPGLSARFPIHIQAPATPAAYSVLFHLASNVPDSNPGDNDVTAAFRVSETEVAAADLAVTVRPAEVTVAPGAQLGFDIVVDNRGTAAASGITLIGAVPAGMTLVSARSQAGSCASSNDIICIVPSLAIGGTNLVHVVLAAPASEGVRTIELHSTSLGADRDPSNDGASLRITVVEHPRRRPVGH